MRVLTGESGPPVIIEKNAGKSVEVVGRLFKKEIKSTYQILYLEKSQMCQEGQWYDSSTVIIYDYSFSEVRLGNIIQVHGELELFSRARNPGNFNQYFYYAKQGIHGAVKADRMKVVMAAVDELAEWLSDLREAWRGLLHEGAGEEAGGILDSILLGEKTGMNEEVKELYQKNGIGHILAISGLHISFIGMGLYYLLRKTGMPIWLAAVLSVVVLSLYLLMIGRPVSSVRAFIMFCLRMGAEVSGRRYDGITALALAAVIISWFSPLYLLDAGFLLSFGAILGLLGILPIVDRLFPDGWKWLSGLKAGAAVNVILLPLLLYFYFEFPLYSILLNLLIVPLMSVVMATALAASLIWCISPSVGSGVFWICRGIFWLFEWLCEIASQWPLFRIITGQPKMWQMILYYVLLVLILCCLNKQQQKKADIENHKGSQKGERCIGIVGLILLFAVITFRYERGGDLRVVMVDVGQGDGIFIYGPGGKTYLIDGGSSDVSQVGKYRIEPFLKSQGVAGLDYIFISHGDADHINGVLEMLHRQKMGVRIRHLVLPPLDLQDESLKELARAAKDNGTKVYTMNPGDIISEEGMNLTYIQPTADYDGKIGNAASMVLSLTYGAFDMLFTGDVEEKGEELLKKNLGQKQYDVLKAAHHGSKNSGDEEILRMIKPAYTFISAGEDNRYGHPHRETLERLKESGSEVYCTAEAGGIILWTDGERVKITCWLE